LPPFVSRLDESDLAEDPQVLGHDGLRDAESLDQVVHRLLSLGEQVEDLPPSGLRDRVERVRCGRRSCHGLDDTYPYRHMSIEPEENACDQR
jgi:hypothetical protein